MQIHLKAFFIVGLWAVSSSTQAAYSGAVTAATAGAGRAAVEASEGPFLNPATLPMLKGYYFSSSMGSSVSDGQTTRDFTASLTDNMKDTVVPTALAYGQTEYRRQDGEEISSRQARLSFGGYWTRSVTSGLGLVFQEDRQPGIKYSQSNMVFAVQWVPAIGTRDLGFTSVFENILPNSESVPEKLRLKQTTALGFVWNYKKFMRVKADLISSENNTFTKPTPAVGLENYLNKWMILRIGAQRNNQDEYNLYSAGLGFVLPKFGFHYALQSSPENNEATRHTVDLAVPIW